MVAGFSPAAAKPVFRERPYRRRKPPVRIGWEKTGRPAIRSRRYLSFGFTPVSSSSDFAAPPIRTSSHSHPAIFIFRTFFWTFGAFRASPSAITSAIPPRTVFVSTRSRFRYPETSACSVASPSMQTGQFSTIIRISFSLGRYWRLMIELYCRISST